MEHDDRDRRDRPDEADQPSDEPTEPIEPAGAAPGSSSAAEPWPSEDPTGASAPGEPASEQAWPTEPPSAGSAPDETWPTAAPERGDAPILEPSSADGPAPEEVEAYPASSPTSEPVPTSAEGEFAQGSVDEAAPSEVEAYPAAAPVDAAPVADVTAAHSVPAAESATGESTQCPRCGTENRPGLAFCRNCGQRLVAAGVASTVERPGVPEGTQACARCGTHNRAGVGFCQNCGANLRGTAPGYVPPAVADEEVVAAHDGRRGAVLGPVVLLIGLIGIITAYLLPFIYGTGSLFERAFSAGGYGVSFWNGYPEASASIADQAYFGLAAPAPLLGLLLLALAVAGFVRAAPGMLQTVGLAIALLWSAGLVILFLVVELAANWGGDIVGLLRDLSPAGIIFFLAGLIVLIGTLTRFGRS